MTTEPPASGLLPDTRALVDGREAPLEHALAAAAELLSRARRPLVYGLAGATVDAQRAAVELAERLGAVIDPAGSIARAGGARAFRTQGEATATLGEAGARAELLVFWGVDPDAVHPGFSDLYLKPTPGAPMRTSLAADVGDARGPARADERITIDAADEIELLWALRASVRGRRLDAPAGALSSEWSADAVRVFAGRLASSPYAVLFFAAEPPAERRDPLRALALTALAAEVKAPGRLRVLGVRPPGNMQGAEAVLTWQTGYPSAVDFAPGYPRYGPGEYEAERLLERGEVDAVLLVGAPARGELSSAASAALERLPTVFVGADEHADAGVAFQTLPPELTPGSVYRMDALALRRRAQAGSPPGLTDQDVLRGLLSAVGKRRVPA